MATSGLYAYLTRCIFDTVLCQMLQIIKWQKFIISYRIVTCQLSLFHLIMHVVTIHYVVVARCADTKNDAKHKTTTKHTISIRRRDLYCFGKVYYLILLLLCAHHHHQSSSSSYQCDQHRARTEYSYSIFISIRTNHR